MISSPEFRSARFLDRSIRRLFWPLASSILALCPAVEAATITHSASTTNFENTASWVGGVVPTSADVALFDGTSVVGNTTMTYNNNSNLTLGGFQITNPEASVTFTIASGRTFTFGGTAGSTTIDMSAATQDFTITGSGTFRLNTISQTWNVAAGRTLTISSNGLTVQGNSKTLSLTGGGNIVINSSLSPSGTNPIGLDVAGANVTLNGSNSWRMNNSVEWRLSSGTLNLGNDNALGSAASSSSFGLNGGTLTAAGGTRSISVTNGFSLGGDFTIADHTDGAQALTLASSLTQTGGNRTLTNNSILPVTLSGGIGLSSSTTIRNMTFAGSGTTIVSGVIANNGVVLLKGTTDTGSATSGSVTYNGTGTLVLSNANTFSGSLIQTNGTIRLDNTLAAQNAALSIATANGVTFGIGITAAKVASLTGTGNLALTDHEANGVELTVGNNDGGATYSGVLSGNGSLVKIGSGTQVLNISGHTYTGPTKVSGGTLQTNSSAETNGNAFGSGGIYLTNGGRVRFNSTSGTNINSALEIGTGGGTLSVRGNSTFNPTAITGTGTLTITPDNGITVTPITFQNFGGTVSVIAAGASGILRLGNGFDNGSMASMALDLGAGITLSRVTGTNGSVITSIGTLSGNATSVIGNSGSGGGLFTFSIGGRNEDATFAGVIQNGGTETALTKVGTGIQTLSGANTYTGATNVNGGKLLVSGSLTGTTNINNGGTLGGTGTLAGLALNAGGALEAGSLSDDLGATTLTWNGESSSAFAQVKFELSTTDQLSDRITLTGALTKGSGSFFQFDFLNSGMDGASYTIFTFDTQSGFSVSDFSFVNLASGLSGSFELQNNALVFHAVPEPGSLSSLLLGTGGVLGLSRRRRTNAQRPS